MIDVRQLTKLDESAGKFYTAEEVKNSLVRILVFRSKLPISIAKVIYECVTSHNTVMNYEHLNVFEDLGLPIYQVDFFTKERALLIAPFNYHEFVPEPYPSLDKADFHDPEFLASMQDLLETNEVTLFLALLELFLFKVDNACAYVATDVQTRTLQLIVLFPDCMRAIEVSFLNNLFREDRMVLKRMERLENQFKENHDAQR